MSLNINVRLGGSGGGGGRQAKLSAKQSHQTNKQVVQSSSNGIIQGLKVAKRAGSSALGGSEALLSFTANSVRLGIVYGGVKTAERGLYVLSNYREVRSGESMLESNYRAKVKTGVNLGLNIVYGEIRNMLFKQPQIVRQNMSINYERDLYNYSIYSEKYKFR
jgi:hypothetical protein